MEKNIQPDFRGKKVAILTSGGDSQGMNAAIRSCGRMTLSIGARMFIVKMGYQGLVDGGDSIQEWVWKDFSKIIHIGGTIIESARCMPFITLEGRRKACLNMVRFGISNLIVIGGDGSLTGASIFRSEWSTHLAELLKEGKITESEKVSMHHLSIVGMIGSIDNDFCGTDMTIGTDSALHRIIECVDSIITTAASHHRAFVVEVMGRHAGYLALTSGIAVGADYILIPESPPNKNWQETLCDSISNSRKHGKKYSIVLVSEGAQDCSGAPITSNEVQNVLEKCMQLDVRVTVLGHIQRGGSPSAYDRILATRQGIEAAINVLVCNPDDPSYVICTNGNKIVRRQLQECISLCNSIKVGYKNQDLSQVCSSRGVSFQRNLELFQKLQNLAPMVENQKTKVKSMSFAVVHIGAPAAGMDPCTRAFTIWCISKGHRVYGFKNGFKGMIAEDFNELTWSMVESWFSNGGSSLGADRFEMKGKEKAIADALKKMEIKGLLIVGGFDSIVMLQALHNSRESYPSLKIPIIMIPASCSNNIPCTAFSLGADTTLNVIIHCCDSLRLSAKSSRKRIFVVKTFGKNSGYLASMSAIASAADNAYSMQNSPTIYDILKDIENFKEKFRKSNLDFGLLVVSDQFSRHYTVNTITEVLNEQGQPLFTSRASVIGHIQQGAFASPYDRFLSSKFGSKAAEKMLSLIEESEKQPELFLNPSSCCMIGITSQGYAYSDIEKLIEESDMTMRIPKKIWWEPEINILKILSDSDFIYTSVTIPNVTFRKVRSL